MLLSILILLALPVLDFGRRVTGPRFTFWGLLAFWSFMFFTVLLGWLGGMPAEEPYTTASQLASIGYFGYFVVALPLLARTDRV